MVGHSRPHHQARRIRGRRFRRQSVREVTGQRPRVCTTSRKPSLCPTSKSAASLNIAGPTISQEYIFDSHWILEPGSVHQDGPIFSEALQKQLTCLCLLRWSWQGLPAGRRAKRGPRSRRPHGGAITSPAFQTEDFMPPVNELKARVDFIYPG